MIKLVGIELEGGWRKTFASEGLVFVKEASVVQPADYVRGRDHWGELVSPPMERALISPWIRAHYPDNIPPPVDVGTNTEKSCGLHVHVSFSPEWRYKTFTEKPFQMFALEKFKQWADLEGMEPGCYFLYRWEGKNRFATRVFQPGPQMEADGKGRNRLNRRSIFNYPWGYLKTLEFRMLPMFPEVDRAVRAVEFYLGIVDEWLARPPEPTHIIKDDRIVIEPSVTTERKVIQCA